MVVHKYLLAFALLASLLLAAPEPAEAVVVERIVAVVGEKAILLTDLRKRARPALVKLYTKAPPGPQRAAAESQIYRQVIEIMVNEELEAMAAARNNTRVTAEEVDKALRQVARGRGIPLSRLFEAVEAETGMSEVEYRQEIRRQVLEGKLLNRFIQNQRITQQQLEAMFERVRKQERQVLLYQPAWIVFRVGETPTDEQLRSRMAVAKDVVKRARAGADFGSLAQQYSEDTTTAKKGGTLGIRVPVRSPQARSKKFKMLARDLERRALRLDVGEVSEPFRFKQALVVMTVASRQPSRFTSVAAARNELAHMVRVDKLQAIKIKWLGDLRRRTHVDVRL